MRQRCPVQSGTVAQVTGQETPEATFVRTAVRHQRRCCTVNFVENVWSKRSLEGTSKRSGAGPLPALPGSKDEAESGCLQTSFS